MSATDYEFFMKDNEPNTQENARGLEQTVLVVEDNEMVRRLLIKILNLDGYKILEAAHGTEALELSDRHRGQISLMVTDLVVPGMSGRELADEMAQRRPEMSVLFISGYTDDRRMHSLREGVDFLSKPFLPITLLNKIREILDRRMQAARNATNRVEKMMLLSRARSRDAQRPAAIPKTAHATAWGKAFAASETRAFTSFLELIIGGL
jgi:DNA-binding response OmpR family regulator